MSYLPSEIEAEVKQNRENSQAQYKDFYFDETTGTFTGVVATGISALKGWIYFALRIARYRYPIYSYVYGCELENLISETIDDDDYLESEVKRMIEDALLINPHISEIDEVAVSKNESKLEISCTVKTKYGDIYVKV